MHPSALTPPTYPGESTLDTLLAGLCDVYGLNAVGQSLARQHGRTRAIAAVLGHLETAAAHPVSPVASPSIAPATDTPPA